MMMPCSNTATSVVSSGTANVAGHEVPGAVGAGAAGSIGDLESWNRRFALMTAEERVRCAIAHLPGAHVLTSSFGAQAAVSLHMLVSAAPETPVVLLDTGYLFPETYAFVEQLTERLRLNLKVYRSLKSPAWQESRHGRRWEQGLEGLDQYNYDNKIEPMQRALEELRVGTWFSGLRRSQSASRRDTPFLGHVNGRYKVCPIADWTDRDVYDYLQAHDLPYHPLWEKGYVSIGDTHTTVRLADADSAEATRFFGLKRECGLHDQEL